MRDAYASSAVPLSIWRAIGGTANPFMAISGLFTFAGITSLLVDVVGAHRGLSE